MAAVRPRHARLALLACLVGLGGCAAEPDTHLLELARVAPERVEPGVALAVEGAGFPEGRPGAITLRGVLHRPGERSLPVERSFEGRAVAPDRFELPVTPELVTRIGGRGTFAGAIELRFEGASDGTLVSGLLPEVEVDVLPAAADRLAGAAERLRAALAHAEALGIVLADEQPEEGVLVADVRAGSAAAAQGLVAGMQITTVDGVRVADVSDLRPRPSADATVLRVRRPDGAADLEVRLPLAAERAQSAPGDVLTVASLTLVALFLLLVAPTARATSLLSRCPSRGEAGGWAWLLAEDERAPGGPAWRRRAPRIALAALAVSGALASIAEVGMRVGARRAVVCLLVGAAATRAVVAVLTPGRPVGRELTRAALGTAASLAAVAGAGLLAAARPVGPSGWPWRWLVFESPVAFALFGAFALATLGSVRPPADAPAPIHHVARLHLVLGAGLGAVLFLGGWSPPVPASSSGTLGVAWVVAQGWALVALGLWTGRRFPTLDARGFQVALPLALAGLAAAIAWLTWPSADSVTRVSGPLLCASTVGTWLGVAVQGRRARGPELRLHPFL